MFKKQRVHLKSDNLVAMIIISRQIKLNPVDVKNFTRSSRCLLRIFENFLEISLTPLLATLQSTICIN